MRRSRELTFWLLVLIGVLAGMAWGGARPWYFLILPLVVWAVARFERRLAVVAAIGALGGCVLVPLLSRLQVTGRAEDFGLFFGTAGILAGLTAWSRWSRGGELKAHSEHEQQLEQAQVLAGLGHFTLDISSGRWRSSPVLDQVLGLGPDYDRTSAGWVALVHPEDRGQVLGDFRDERAAAALAAGKEFRIIRASDQAVRWVHRRAQVEYEARRPVALRGTIQDITERKSAELETQAARQQLAATFNAIPDLLFEVDLEGRIHAYHSPRHDLLAAQPETFIGQRLYDFIDATAAQTVAEALAEAHATGYSVGRHYQLTLPRGPSWFELSISRMPSPTRPQPRFIVLVRDITARTRAEHTVRESEAQLDGILASSMDGVLAVNAAGKVIRVNRRMQEMWRMPSDLVASKDDQQLLDWALTQLRDPDAFLRKVQELYASGDNSQDELELKDGRVFERTSVPWRMDGVTAGRVWTFRDITARVQAQQALLESRENYQGLFNTVSEAIYVHGTDNVFLDVNEGALRMYGYTREELIGKTPAEVSAPGRNDLSAIARLSAEVFATGRPVALEFWGRRKNGEEFPKACIIHRGKYFGREVLITTTRDISQRVEQEKRIREQAALLEITEDAILVLDLERVITFFNRGAERLYGVSRQEALGQRYEAIAYREVPDGYLAAWGGFLEVGEFKSEHRQFSRSRGEIMVQKRATLVRNESGIATAAMVVVTDLTEAKRLETQFLRAQRLESLGSLASGVAHDLNNVLTPIVMSTGMLADAVQNDRDRALVQLLHDNAQRGADIVQQLLLYGRGSDAPRTLLKIGQVIRDMEQIMRETFPKSLAVQTVVAPDLWMVSGNSTQLHQVLLNLCVNARDAMPAGGRLSVFAENLTVGKELAARQPGATPGLHVVIRVRDTGVGIPPAILERIFDPFFTTKPFGQGSGLGLASVLGIVRSHGGFVTVESQIGAGSEFAVYLPARPAEIRAVAGALARPELQGRGELVLVLDDESAIRESLSAALQRFGYLVKTAGDGAEGLKVFASHGDEVRLVIADIMMPVMDGRQAMAALRQRRPDLPLIAMSGVPTQRISLETSFGPQFHFLQKPFTFDKMLATVRELLDAAG